MAAGVSIKRATEAVGHGRKGGTKTRQIVTGLRALGLRCADRCRPLGRKKPAFPRRGLLAIYRQNGNRRCARFHWMLTWDGEIYDPAGRWPDYPGWRITSYLEIF